MKKVRGNESEHLCNLFGEQNVRLFPLGLKELFEKIVANYSERTGKAPKAIERNIKEEWDKWKKSDAFILPPTVKELKEALKQGDESVWKGLREPLKKSIISVLPQLDPGRNSRALSSLTNSEFANYNYDQLNLLL